MSNGVQDICVLVFYTIVILGVQGHSRLGHWVPRTWGTWRRRGAPPCRCRRGPTASSRFHTRAGTDPPPTNINHHKTIQVLGLFYYTIYLLYGRNSVVDPDPGPGASMLINFINFYHLFWKPYKIKMIIHDLFDDNAFS